MKLRLTLIPLYIWALASLTFSQTNEAKKVIDFGVLSCSYLINFIPSAFDELRVPDSKIYIIYYEGKYYDYNKSIWNEKTKLPESPLVNPMRGDGLNRAQEVKMFLEESEFQSKNIVLINGGYKNELTLELWIAPISALPPKPSLTNLEKHIIFRKGKPAKPRQCAKIYDGL